MSEEKLYAVKDAEGQYWDFEFGKFRPVDRVYHPADFDKEHAKAKARDYGGRVVTFAEEPKKVVLSKEQAQVVKEARDAIWPAKYITDHSDNSNGLEELLMNAYVNGYTVAKEKKYNVKVPKKWSGDDKHYWTKIQDGSLMLMWECLSNKDYMIPNQQFTLTEIEHYGLQDYEKEEVTDDGMGC